jgi:hypothetical protein
LGFQKKNLLFSGPSLFFAISTNHPKPRRFLFFPARPYSSRYWCPRHRPLRLLEGPPTGHLHLHDPLDPRPRRHVRFRLHRRILQ